MKENKSIEGRCVVISNYVFTWIIRNVRNTVGIARGERSFFPENNNHQGKKFNFDFFFCGLDFNPHCASVRFFQSSIMNE